MVFGAQWRRLREGGPTLTNSLAGGPYRGRKVDAWRYDWDPTKRAIEVRLMPNLLPEVGAPGYR